MLQRALDIFRGKAITIPPMDGALRPNTALDEAPVLLQADAPDNLAWIEGRLVFSSANKVLAIDMAGGNIGAGNAGGISRARGLPCRPAGRRLRGGAG